MNNFLIPANTKQGQLILGLFRPFDLILLASAIGISLVLLLVVPLTQLMAVILALAPGLICAFLVLPVPYYHNMLQIIMDLIEFLSNRQQYKWRGWCVDYGNNSKKTVIRQQKKQ